MLQLQAASSPKEIQEARQDLNPLIDIAGCTSMCVNIVANKEDLVTSLTRFIVLGPASEAYQQ